MYAILFLYKIGLFGYYAAAFTSYAIGCVLDSIFYVVARKWFDDNIIGASRWFPWRFHVCFHASLAVGCSGLVIPYINGHIIDVTKAMTGHDALYVRIT